MLERTLGGRARRSVFVVLLSLTAVLLAHAELAFAQDGQVLNEKDLYLESASDFDAFSTKYAGRELAIHGSVLLTTVSDDLENKVQLDYFVTCYTAPEQKPVLATIRQRDWVIVRGVISESFMGRIYLRPCRVEAAASPAPPDMSGVTPPLGKYECWAGSQAQLSLAFTLAADGVYHDFRGQSGRYAYDPAVQTVSMEGAALSGAQLRFSIDPRPQLTFRNPDGSFEMGIACDSMG